jgi:hypothetical protein
MQVIFHNSIDLLINGTLNNNNNNNNNNNKLDYHFIRVSVLCENRMSVISSEKSILPE